MKPPAFLIKEKSCCGLKRINPHVCRANAKVEREV